MEVDLSSLCATQVRTQTMRRNFEFISLLGNYGVFFNFKASDIDVLILVLC